MFRKRSKCKNKDPQANQWHVPKGGLEPSHLNLHLISHHGIPSTASKLSFDPVQRLLAVGTLDGRIKLFGRDGIQGILMSDSRLRCKFLEFANNTGHIVNITAENDIQIWDLERRVLAQTHRWSSNITAFAVVQGSPYMYIGEDSGDVAVLQYDREENKLCQMPYSIPARTSLGGICQSSYESAPSVVGILPYPESEHSRVLIAYGNGMIILWGLYEAQILRVRGSWLSQTNGFGEEPSHSISDEEGEDKDICCMCRADSLGDLLAVGYTDGDIWFWNLSMTSSRPLDEASSASQATVPLLKLQVSSSASRSPVLALRWSAGSAREGMMGVNGQLFVYGGGELGCSETLMIFFLESASGQLDTHKVCHVDLPLDGPFDDMILLPRPGGTLSDPASALLILTSPGQLHAYDEVNLMKCFLDMKEESVSSLPEPVLLKPFLTDPMITVAKLVLLPEDGKITNEFSKLPRSFKSNVPLSLPGGTKWPVSGGFINKSVVEGSKVRMVFITGHADGSVNVWDASFALLSQLCNLPGRVQLELPESAMDSVSHLDFCAVNGFLAVAKKSGMVSIYALSAKAGEVNCLFVNKSEMQDQIVPQDIGFHNIVVLNLHRSPISSLAVANSPAHVAVGYTDGMVLLFDISLGTILFKDTIFFHGSPQVVSLTFGPALKKAETSAQIASPSVSPSSAVQSNPLLQRAIYAVAKDASVVAIITDTEKGFTSSIWHTDHPSEAVFLHCLEFSSEQKDINKPGSSEQLSEEMMDAGDDLTGIPDRDLSSCCLLLCTQTSVYLYSISTSEQASFSLLKEVSSSASCCWASTFSSLSANASGFILLDSSGSLQIRSIPDLDMVKEISSAEFFKWEPKLSANSSTAIVCADNGHIALVGANRELMFFSLFATDDSLRVTDPVACFYDKDIAAAADAALKAGAQSYSTRRKSQIQEFLGGVLKDLKGGVLKELKGGVLKEIKGGLLKSSEGGKDQHIGIKAPTELSGLFASSPFTESVASPQLDRKLQSESAGSAADDELDIDDIKIEDDDDDEVTSELLDYEAQIGEKSVANLKGKEKVDTSDDRMKLLGGEDEIRKPARRTAEEIKAKYGHKASGEVSGAAGLARDKLLERQEKLQALSKRTEEMQEGAKDFASMAAELVKTMEGRKWWQL